MACIDLIISSMFLAKIQCKNEIRKKKQAIKKCEHQLILPKMFE